MEDLASLIQQAQSGDLSAYDGIVRRFQNMAVGYGYSLLRDYHRAEDAAQEAFIQAFIDLPTLRDPRGFPGWLRKMVHKHCDRHMRPKQFPTVAVDRAVDLTAPGCDPAQLAEKAEMSHCVHVAVAGLPPQERAVVGLFYMGEYSHHEVAAFLEIPVTTVKKRLQSARHRLKERLLAMVEGEMHEKTPSRTDRFADRVKAAISILTSGDTTMLHSLLAKHPDLALARGDFEDDAPPAYFQGATLLHYVAGNPFRHQLPPNVVEIARLLLQAGAAVDARTEEGNTTLGLVVSSAEARRAGVQLALIDVLVQAGADVTIDEGTPMRLALFHGEAAAAQALAQHGARLDLCAAAGLGRLDLVREWWEHGDRDEALICACRTGQIAVVEYFLAQGADINRKIGGATLLHKAVMHGRTDLLAMLIERGADVNVRDDAYQGSPLDWSLYLDRHRTTPADEAVDFLGIAACLRQHGGIEFFTG